MMTFANDFSLRSSTTTGGFTCSVPGTDFDYVLPGGESSRQAQHRVLRVLDEVRTRHNTGTIVVASHGNLITLALHAMADGIDHDFWKAMPLPASIRSNARRTVGGFMVQGCDKRLIEEEQVSASPNCAK
jgi:hypothetical protein